MAKTISGPARLFRGNEHIGARAIPLECQKRHVLGDARVAHMRDNFIERNLGWPCKRDFGSRIDSPRPQDI